ncbi:hypothetical protein ADUPG1_007194 [Aduncisulcus paluster]|uniref:Uncharacterized protein n=1 Tax=Aduncisulcus paluster TaxID=2918883 RepID=A0ABQ5KL37_9EUKA|nr:hypothetical protein ADUPG1_007194 [Aduncisulcus paluster]
MDGLGRLLQGNDELLMDGLINLIISLSKVPSIVPHISPKYDDSIVYYCNTQECITLPSYLQNVYSHISSLLFPSLLHSIPSISLIPTIETTQYPNATSLLPTTHFCDGVKYVSSISAGYLQHQEISTICLIVGGTELEYSRLRYGELCVETCVANERKEEEEAAAEEKETREKEEEEKEEGEGEITRNTRQVTHSSLIKYTPPQHMLVTMSFTEERPLRQSVYDFIERTGACVEILFEEQTCSFEGFDQEAWKEGMEEVEEETDMKGSRKLPEEMNFEIFDPIMGGLGFDELDDPLFFNEFEAEI